MDSFGLRRPFLKAYVVLFVGLRRPTIFDLRRPKFVRLLTFVVYVGLKLVAYVVLTR